MSLCGKLFIKPVLPPLMMVTLNTMWESQTISNPDMVVTDLIWIIQMGEKIQLWQSMYGPWKMLIDSLISVGGSLTGDPFGAMSQGGACFVTRRNFSSFTRETWQPLIPAVRCSTPVDTACPTSSQRQNSESCDHGTPTPLQVGVPKPKIFLNLPFHLISPNQGFP